MSRAEQVSIVAWVCSSSLGRSAQPSFIKCASGATNFLDLGIALSNVQRFRPVRSVPVIRSIIGTIGHPVSTIGHYSRRWTNVSEVFNERTHFAQKVVVSGYFVVMFVYDWWTCSTVHLARPICGSNNILRAADVFLWIFSKEETVSDVRQNHNIDLSRLKVRLGLQWRTLTTPTEDDCHVTNLNADSFILYRHITSAEWLGDSCGLMVVKLQLKFFLNNSTSL